MEITSNTNKQTQNLAKFRGVHYSILIRARCVLSGLGCLRQSGEGLTELGASQYLTTGLGENFAFRVSFE